MPEEIFKYFPDLSDLQKEQFRMLKPIYSVWNSRINVVSRKDMENFYLHHVLHSLAVAKIISFVHGTTLLDVGTGGGFPGIPLAILFPDSRFSLMDSIEKKVKVVSEVCRELNLTNTNQLRLRAEDHMGKYDFVLSRAVASFPQFVKITKKNILRPGKNNLPNGIIYLKGGDLTDELNPFKKTVKVFDIRDFFRESYFETKKIIFLPS